MAEPTPSLTLATKFYGFVPVGTIVPWHKSTPGTPSLPAGWVECNGQTLSDPESPLHNQPIPDINGQGWFVRGSATSGNPQLADTLIPNHTHTHSLTLPNHEHQHCTAVLSSGTATGVLATAIDTSCTVAVNANRIVRNPTTNPTISGGITSSGSSGTETRPKNISMVFIIRVK